MAKNKSTNINGNLHTDNASIRDQIKFPNDVPTDDGNGWVLTCLDGDAKKGIGASKISDLIANTIKVTDHGQIFDCTDYRTYSLEFPGGFVIQWCWVYVGKNTHKSITYPVQLSKFLGASLDHCASTVDAMDNISAYEFTTTGCNIACGHNAGMNMCVTIFGIKA